MQIKRHKRRRLAAPIGTLFVVLAAIGVITLIVSSIRLTTRVLDNSKEKVTFANIIRPVVMFNPAPFEKASDIDPISLLQYSMWSALMSEKRDAYGYGSSTELVVPASDLDVACARLFGPDVALVHQSFGDYDTTYYYDEPKGVYNVLPSAQLYVYTPEVVNIVRDGEFYNLTVDYIPPGDAWKTTFDGEKKQPVAEKQMIYVMKKSKDSYQLVKVLDAPSQTSSYTIISPSSSSSQAE